MTPLLTIARGDASNVTEPRRLIARSEEEWRALWAVHAGPDAASPLIDFAQVIAAAAFAGEKPSAGHSIEISAAPSRAGLRLAVTEHAPGPGIVAAAMMTSPFHIVAIPREAGDVTWDGIGVLQATPGRSSTIDPRSSNPEPRSRLAPPASRLASSSTGMDPRTASALAYLAGPFSGALILFAESANPDVRFHAWQSIIGLGGLGLAVIASYALAFAAMFESARVVSLLIYTAGAIWFVLLIVWALCLWKAWSGERWKLPLAGDYAERLAKP
jgi:uncharacterized membrane protein